MSTSEEKVLVVSTTLFRSLGYFQGFTTDVLRYIPALLAPEQTSFRPRAKVETDPGFKQLIPYMFFSHTGANGEMSVFQYVRGHGMGESRLHSKRSIGVGGHISSDDVIPSPTEISGEHARLPFGKTDSHAALPGTFNRLRNGTGTCTGMESHGLYRTGMLRELHEEVDLRSPYTEQCVGLINDDETEVGKVHLGIVHHFRLERPDLISRETDLIESGFVPLQELLVDLTGFETWSAICLTALFGH